MHGILGCIEHDARCVDSMGRWMREWIRLTPCKEAFELRCAPFFYLSSDEPGRAERPTASAEDGLVLACDGFVARDQLQDADHPEPGTDSEVAAALLRLYRRKAKIEIPNSERSLPVEEPGR